MKKFLSILLATMMVLAMVGTAFADEETTKTYTITISNNKPGHTYEAYQIFSGTPDGEQEDVLGNYTWGTGISTDGVQYYGDAVATGKSLTSAADANAFANEIAAKYLGTKAGEVSVAADATTVEYKITGLPGGYYLIIDKAGTLGDPTSDSYSSYMMKVAADVTVTPKVGEVTIEKKVQDVNDSTQDPLDADMAKLSADGWDDSADYDIDDEIPYRLTGTLPANFADYTTYEYKFVDEMSEGLTYVDGSAVVYIKNGETMTKVSKGFSATWQDQVLTVAAEDLKTLENETGATISVTKDSFVVVFYKAKLNEKAKIGEEGNPNTVKLQYSNNPYADGLGTTITDTNIVFTYKVVVNKVDGYNKPLTGAAFELSKYDAKNKAWTKVDLAVNTDGTVFTAEGLDDGIYKIVETKVPDGFNAAKDIYFEVTASHEEEAIAPKLTELKTIEPTDSQVKTEMENGVVGEFTASMTDGSLTTSIENLSGATLPETGGIGTTLFYLFGGIMAAGSALILIVRRRADAEEE